MGGLRVNGNACNGQDKEAKIIDNINDEFPFEVIYDGTNNNQRQYNDVNYHYYITPINWEKCVIRLSHQQTRRMDKITIHIGIIDDRNQIELHALMMIRLVLYGVVYNVFMIIIIMLPCLTDDYNIQSMSRQTRRMNKRNCSIDEDIVLFRLLHLHPQMMTIIMVTTNNDSTLITIMMSATNNTIVKNDIVNKENESIDIVVQHHCTLFAAVTRLPPNTDEESNNEEYIDVNTNWTILIMISISTQVLEKKSINVHHVELHQ